MLIELLASFQRETETKTDCNVKNTFKRQAHKLEFSIAFELSVWILQTDNSKVSIDFWRMILSYQEHLRRS